MERVLVTGGTGVTGVALVRYLLEENIEVIALLRPNSMRQKYLPQNQKLHIVYCDMDEYQNKDKDVTQYGRIDAFFHLAWDGSTLVDKVSSRDNMPLQAMNIVYTVNAVELCKKINCPVFVMTGSQAEFGAKNMLVNESMTSIPVNGYGSAKLCAETMTRVMCKNYGIKHIFARLFSIYGPYDGTNSLIYTSIQKLLKGIRPSYTKAEQKWDFLFSFDAARALYLLAENGKDGEMYCVANGNSKCLYEYIMIIHQVCNPAIEPIFGELPYPKNQLMVLGADISKLKQVTGFEPQYTFEAGIKMIKDWFVETNEEYTSIAN